ncbi:hypothetical protein GGTG_04844 [Gaeumannomyces tritici R3-111a-1]|uniref:SWIRM domain-containing protein n=1 Tax=Gaeumannomyces tritici (strain R3-111a-1) TaxID=644352 RepID=J3NU89_GAET3|nr:hypothetical protein GGTG_04844 [Gaeumannomyces tritici R3-111a-1]EJT79760.1 hypothetical protein GGTG_04844 [Gaeumannomyces tritici R3-111a-1]
MVHQTTSAVRTLYKPPVFTSPATTKPTSAKIPVMETSREALKIVSLMSPPELPPFETFSQSALSATPTIMRPSSDERRTGPDPPLSPPISPFAKSTNCIDPTPASREGSQHDPILYPGAADISPTPSHQPLFKAPGGTSSPVPVPAVAVPIAAAAPAVAEDKRSVDQHLASRPSYLFKVTTPPKRDEYELALYFKSSVMQSYTQNPSGWLRKERAILMEDKRASMKAAEAKAKFQPILPAKTRRPSAMRVSKPKPLLPIYKPLITAASSPGAAGAGTTAAGGGGGKPVGPNREDKAFEMLPDFCPPLGSLPANRPNCLKVDWKGNALDLTNDPHAHRLHPDERLLAAGLRLDCATYLTSKRRIFMRRLECARIGKEFRKTDAQQACKIDVNKASKLWTAYERVRWLDVEWMKPYI